jgi:hypothetical protein
LEDKFSVSLIADAGTDDVGAKAELAAAKTALACSTNRPFVALYGVFGVEEDDVKVFCWRLLN